MGFGHEKKPSSLLKLSLCKSYARLAACFMEYAGSLGFITAVTTNGANFAHFPTKQLSQGFKGKYRDCLGASGREW